MKLKTNKLTRKDTTHIQNQQQTKQHTYKIYIKSKHTKTKTKQPN